MYGAQVRGAGTTTARVARATAVIIVLGFYAWTTLTSVSPTVHQQGGAFNDQYNALGDAFARGHLAVAVKPQADLLKLGNPLDPVANGRFRTFENYDLSLYHGRFYAYWGPVPALLLFAPAHLLGFSSFPVELATFLFAAVAFLAAVGLLGIAVRRWAPRVPVWAHALAILVLGLANGAIYALRLPETHQAAIVAGAAFLLLGLYLLARGLREARPGPAWLAGASACVALAVGSRATLVVAVLVPVALAVWLRRRRSGGTRALVALLGPLAVGLAALAVYDAARFGSPFETGLSYQFGGIDWSHVHAFHPEIVGDGLRYHLLRPVLVRAQFPYLWLDPEQIAPDRFLYAEPMSGLLITTPVVVLVGLVGLRGARLEPYAKAAALGVAGLGAVLALELASFPSVAMRFSVDYASLLMLAALGTWLLLLSGRRLGRRRRRAVAVAGGVLAAWTLVVNAALSLSAERAMPRLHPTTFAALERAFSPLPSAASSILGRPLLEGVDHEPVLPVSRPGALPTAYELSTARPLVVRVFSPGAARRRLAASIGPAPGHGQGSVRIRSADGFTATAQTRAGSFSVPIALRRGRNEVTIEAVGRPGAHPADFRLAGFALHD